MRHYYLYFFALIFSVTLYFSFVTLQYNPSVADASAEGSTASAGFEAATYMLYFIVLFFVLYANHLFMKRRSKEIGMYQLIGMTKGLVFRLIALENIVLFVGAVLIGMGLGFLSSRIFAMILLKILEQDVVVGMTFSSVAVQQTCMVFAVLLLVILVQMSYMIRRVTLLSLFSASKQADERVKRFNLMQMAIGAIGLCLIVYGYYASAQLFDIGSANNLYLNMLVILATTIGGTFLVFRFSVSFIMNIWRSSKGGHLSTVDVVAVTPLMHRMKGNAKSLTLITVLTAVSLAITTLSCIAYYSINTMTHTEVPADYVTVDDKGAPFLALLDEAGIEYEEMTFHMKTASFSMEQLLEKPLSKDSPLYGGMRGVVPVVSQTDYQQLNPEVKLSGDEAILAAYTGYLAELFPLVADRQIDVTFREEQDQLQVVDIQETQFFSTAVTRGSSPVLVLADEKYEELALDNSLGWSKQVSINLKDETDLEKAEALYVQSGAAILEEGAEDDFRYTQSSQKTVRASNLNSIGVAIFTTAFLGLAFLMATCSILYFKQMAEADEEQVAYTIMRKIGFSEQELMRGIYVKQLFNFGVPLLIGLLHSYFAVKSGWWLFGSELVEPLWITMILYIFMYAIFAILSIQYYKKIIKQAL